MLQRYARDEYKQTQKIIEFIKMTENPRKYLKRERREKQWKRKPKKVNK